MPTMTAAQKTDRRGHRRLGDLNTVATCIAAAMIALAAPAHADDSGRAFLADFDKAGATVCALTGNGMTDAQGCPTRAPGRHGYPHAPGTYDGYLITPHGYLGKP
jgi:hypothetical protein